MRPHSAVVLALAVLGAAAPPQPPVICRYRLNYRGELTRITIVGHNVTQEKIPTTTTGILTLRLADTVGGRVVDLTVDSMAVTRTDGRTVPDAGDGTGARWHGVTTEDGKFTTLAYPSSVPATRPLERFVRFLLPPVPSAAGPQGSWVDTTAWTTDHDGETGLDSVVTSYTGLRRERRDGKDVRVLAGAWTATRNGSAPAGPEPVTMTAKASGRSEYAWVAGEVCPVAAWRAGSTTLTRTARAFREPVTTTTSDSMVVVRMP
jgi:hypothetical protein